jgi:hypothetical protein
MGSGSTQGHFDLEPGALGIPLSLDPRLDPNKCHFVNPPVSEIVLVPGLVSWLREIFHDGDLPPGQNLPGVLEPLIIGDPQQDQLSALAA